MLGNLKNIYTVAKVKKDVPGWCERVSRLCLRNGAHAAGPNKKRLTRRRGRPVCLPLWRRSLQGFKEEATFLYRTISEGIASGRVADVRRHLTDLMFGELKRQVKSRELGGWERVHWELVRSAKKIWSASQPVSLQARSV